MSANILFGHRFSVGRANNAPALIALGYFLGSVLWIVFSDRILAALVSSPASLTGLQTVKGLGFVFISAMLLFITMRVPVNRLSKSNTTLAQAEKRAEESEKEYRLLAENSADVIWLYDIRAERFTYISPSTEKLSGYTPAEVQRQSLKEALTDDSYQMVARLMPQRIAAVEHGNESMRIQSSEVGVRRKDGTSVPTETVTTLLQDENGRVNRLLGVSRDISERKRSEKALRVKDELIHMTSEIAKVGGWEFDVKSGQATWTDEVVRIHDMDPAEATSTNKILSFYNKASRQLIKKATNDATRHGMSYDLELEMVTRNGNHKWVRAMGFPVTEDGQVTRLRGIIKDITEGKAIEMERETAIDFLRLINEGSDTQGLIRQALEFFHEKSGCEAAGIRFSKNGDYPYYEVRGFSREFVAVENSLCSQDEDGNVRLDGNGRPFLDCMCGVVIQGRTDPSKPFFSPGGSFWTNNTTNLLATTSAADRQGCACHNCNDEGYESMALIPIRRSESCLGLLQLNDHRPNMFTPPANRLLGAVSRLPGGNTGGVPGRRRHPLQ